MNDENNPQIVVEEKKKKKVSILTIILLLIVIAGSIGAWFIYQGLLYDDTLEPNAVIGIMPGKSLDEIQAEMDQQVKESEIAFTINAQPKFANGKAAGNILFENPEGNGKYIRVELVDDATGDLLYKSGLLKPGTYVAEAKLAENFEKGVYTCTATIFSYKLADKSYIGKVEAAIIVTIEN